MIKAFTIIIMTISLVLNMHTLVQHWSEVSCPPTDPGSLPHSSRQ